MNNNQFERPKALTFRRYCRGGWAIMESLHRQTRIGVLSVAMLATTQVQAASSNNKRVKIVDNIDNVENTDSLSEVTVTGSVAPLTALQAARIVQVITRDEIQRSAAQTVNDILKSASGVDVRQRGGFGIQTDISIDGGTFDQIAILLNGIDISSPQTGHHSAYFPVNPSDIERIEILEGAASRAYGNAAFGGAINIVTRKTLPPAPLCPPSQSQIAPLSAARIAKGQSSFGPCSPQRAGEMTVGAQGGSYGTFGADARASMHGQTLSASYIQSDGGTDNSAFRKVQAYSSFEVAKSRSFEAFVQAGLSQKQYGANTFYSTAYPDQWEAQRRYIVSATAQIKTANITLSPNIYWQRSTDHFQLIRHSTTGENFHRTDVYGAELKGHVAWAAGKTAFGTDIRNEGILSTNLGRPLDSAQYVALRYHDNISYDHRDNRTQLSYYLEHNILLPHWTVSAGIRTVMNTAAGNKMRYYPGIDIAWRPNTAWKLFASYNKGFRAPTFTDLYYKSPTLNGNQNLGMEEQHSIQLGATFRHRWLTTTARTFLHRGRHMIDWVMFTPDDIYHSTAFDLDNYGAQINTTANFKDVQMKLGYTWMHQRRHDDTEIFKSNYALEYLRHKVTAQLSHPIVSHLSASWDFRLCDRNGAYISYPAGKLTNYSPYAVLDLKLQWVATHCSVWVSAQNLTNHRYYDLGNIPQPGAWIMAGARWKIF